MMRYGRTCPLYTVRCSLRSDPLNPKPPTSVIEKRLAAGLTDSQLPLSDQDEMISVPTQASVRLGMPSGRTLPVAVLRCEQ
jgi:hypothetical protein